MPLEIKEYPIIDSVSGHWRTKRSGFSGMGAAYRPVPR